MAKNKKKRKDVVYSTNPDFDYSYDEHEEDETLSPSDQHLYVYHDRKQRKGKTVTIVEGFVGSREDVNILSKELKSTCGVGGSVKDNLIIIQGENRDKVVSKLLNMNYRVTKKGG